MAGRGGNGGKFKLLAFAVSSQQTKRPPLFLTAVVSCVYFVRCCCRMYSKSMSNPESNFEQGTDAGYKHVMAEKAYKDAAETTGLTAVYTRLQGLQSWRKEEEDGGAVDVAREEGGGRRRAERSSRP